MNRGDEEHTLQLLRSAHKTFIICDFNHNQIFEMYVPMYTYMYTYVIILINSNFKKLHYFCPIQNYQ